MYITYYIDILWCEVNKITRWSLKERKSAYPIYILFVSFHGFYDSSKLKYLIWHLLFHVSNSVNHIHSKNISNFKYIIQKTNCYNCFILYYFIIEYFHRFHRAMENIFCKYVLKQNAHDYETAKSKKLIVFSFNNRKLSVMILSLLKWR